MLVVEIESALFDLWRYFQLCDVLVIEKKFRRLLDIACVALIYPPFMNDAELAKVRVNFRSL